MNLINYVDYKHSYAHAIAPELRVLNIHANVGHKPVQYLRAIIKRAMRENDVHFTEKEQQFWDTIHVINDSKELYFYCKNCVSKAKETFVYVDDDGELRQFA